MLQRGDEPAEMLGYWLNRHGRQLKMAVKRGIADGAIRLYTERNALRYDGNSRGVRMADVIELTHPKPRDAKQSALFRWLLDHRHHNDAVADPAVLPKLAAAAAQKAITGEGDVPLTPVRVAAWNFLEGKHGTSVVVADKEDQAVRLVIGIAWDEGLAAEDVGQSIDYFAPIISDQPGLLDLLTNR